MKPSVEVTLAAPNPGERKIVYEVVVGSDANYWVRSSWTWLASNAEDLGSDDEFLVKHEPS